MPLKPGYRRRAGRRLLRGLLGLALLAALAAAGHALLWRWMGDRLEAGFEDWVALRRAQGWRVEHAAPVRGGWPFTATLTLPRFWLAGGGATLPGGMDWQAETLLLRLAPPRLDRLAVEMPGRHRLRLGGLDLPFAAERLVATMPLEEGVLPREARLTATRLRLGTPAGALEARDATAGIEARMTATEGEPAVALHLDATEVVLPEAMGPAVRVLGRGVARAQLDFDLTGPVPPGHAPAARAEAWRDGGGALDLHGLALRWGPLAATGSATLTLDEALQPMGAGTLRVEGAAEALQAAAEAGLLSRGALAAARTVLRILAKTPADGRPAALDLPLRLEDRVLTAGRLPVAELPAWRWPVAAPRPALPASEQAASP